MTTVEMPTVLKGTVPPPHLQLTTSLPWSTYNSHCYPPTSSPGPMTPESLNSYATRLHDSPLTSQDTPVHTSAPAWFAPSVPAMDAQQEVGYIPTLAFPSYLILLYFLLFSFPVPSHAFSGLCSLPCRSWKLTASRAPSILSHIISPM